MITTKQKWAIGGLVTLSTAVWTPQILQRLGADQGTRASVPSGPDESEMIGIEMGAGTGTPMGHTAPLPRPIALPQASGSTQPGESSMSGGSSPSGSSAIVSEVLRTLRQSEAFGVEEEAARVTAAVEDTGEAAEEEERLPALLTFVKEHPLRGTIVGETVSVALIGKMRVRLGETVPGTGAVLTKVERGRATLDDGGLIIELELRPLETSASLMRERDKARAQAAPGAVGADPFQSGGGSLPGGESIPSEAALNSEPVGPQSANNDSSSSQGDF